MAFLLPKICLFSHLRFINLPLYWDYIVNDNWWIMERAIDWILFIGIFTIFPTLVYSIHNALPEIGWFSVFLVSFVGSGIISAIFITPVIAIIFSILDLFSD